MARQPRVIGDAFKLAVAMYLQEVGFPDARPTPGLRKLSETLRYPGDLNGLPVVAMVSARRGIEFSRTLNQARDAACGHGLPFVAICSRSGYPIEESYAVMTLEQLADLMQLIPSEEPATE